MADVVVFGVEQDGGETADAARSSEKIHRCFRDTVSPVPGMFDCNKGLELGFASGIGGGSAQKKAFPHAGPAGDNYWEREYLA